MYDLSFIDPPMLEITKKETDKNHFSNRKLESVLYENATVLPFKSLNNDLIGGGVISSSGVYVQNTSLHVGIGSSYDYPKSEVININEEVVFLGFFHPTWGHFLVDSIKKMWFLFSTVYLSLKARNLKFIYTCTPDFRFSDNIVELLTVLNIEVDQLCKVDKPTLFKSVIVPDDSFINDEFDTRFYTKEYKTLIERFKLYAEPLKNDYEKIYFTRTKLNSNKDIGEKSIERMFRKFGYKVFSPEKMTFKEQVSVLHNCSSFATTEGSISHNALFLKENSNLILVRKASFINIYSFPINQMNKLQVSYIDAHLSVFTNKDREWAGPFFLYLNDNLKKYFGINHSCFNKSLFKKYFEVSLESGFFGESNIDSYYYCKLNEEIRNGAKINKLRNFMKHDLIKKSFLRIKSLFN